MRRPPLRRLQDRRTERQCRVPGAPVLTLVAHESETGAAPDAVERVPHGVWVSGHIGPTRRAYPDAPGQVA